MAVQVLEHTHLVRRTAVPGPRPGAGAAAPDCVVLGRAAADDVAPVGEIHQRLATAAALLLAFVLSFAAWSASLWQIAHLGYLFLGPAQAVIIAVLLRSPRHARAAGLAACSAGLLAAGLAAGMPVPLSAGLAAAGVLQAALATACMHGLNRGRGLDITRTIPCAIMLMCGGVLAPAAGSILATATLSTFGHLSVVWLQCGLAEAVGVLVCLPALLTVRLRPGKTQPGGVSARRCAAVLATAAAAAAIFNLRLVAMPDLLLPVLIYVCFIDFGTVMLCLPVVAVSVAVAAGAGTLPFAATDMPVPGLLAPHLFLITTVVIVLPLALVLEERSRLARTSEAALDRAVREGAEKSRFINMLSHEIRTPMNGIIGFADLLGATALTAEQADYVRKTQSAAASLLKMVNDLLDLSKAEAGRMPIRRLSFALRPLCEDVLDVLRATPDARNIALTAQIDPALPERLEGDPTRLQQVLLNLVANALAHTYEGSVQLEIAPVPGNAHHLRFQVRDTGIGIAPERLSELFRPFAQLNDPQSRGGGTGLGLAICKEIVEQMPGGTIGVQSTVGKGSLFWFILALPAASAETGQNVLF